MTRFSLHFILLHLGLLLILCHIPDRLLAQKAIQIKALILPRKLTAFSGRSLEHH